MLVVASVMFLLPWGAHATDSQADLSVDITADRANPVNMNDPTFQGRVNYTVTVANNDPVGGSSGGDAASNVKLKFVVGDKSGSALPLGSPLNITPTQGAAITDVTPGTPDCKVVRVLDMTDPSGTDPVFPLPEPPFRQRRYVDSVECTWASIAAGSSKVVMVAVDMSLNSFVVPQPEGVVVNAARVTSDTADPDAKNDVDVENTLVVSTGIGVTDAVVDEGDAPGSATATFFVYFVGSSPGMYSVNYVTSNCGGTATATAGTDYVAQPVAPTPGTVVFLPGDTVKTVQVPIAGDLVKEGDETFCLDVSAGTLATPPPSPPFVNNRGTATIVNDDCALSITDATAAEGDPGSGNTAQFVIALVNKTACSGNVSVSYATSDGTAVGGSGNSGDYTSVASTTVTFNVASEATKQVSVSVTGDNNVESGEPETFSITLSGASSNATIKAGSATGYIVDDDA